MVARNVRNNNPGNIEHGDDWNGLAIEQSDPRFCTFDSPDYGFRAMIKIMMSYDRRDERTDDGILTLREIISQWAPPCENDTEAYINYVSHNVGIKADEEVYEGDYYKLAAVMAKMEGWPTIDYALAEEGYALV